MQSSLETLVLGVTIVLFCLPNRDGGLIGTLDVQLRITKVSGNSVNFLDEMEITVSHRLMPEYMFKLALIKSMSMIRN